MGRLIRRMGGGWGGRRLTLLFSLTRSQRSDYRGSGKGLRFKKRGRCVGREVSGSQNNGRVDREGDSFLSPSGGKRNVSVAHCVACDKVGDEGEGLSGGF